jgi:hypothetical protein
MMKNVIKVRIIYLMLFVVFSVNSLNSINNKKQVINLIGVDSLQTIKVNGKPDTLINKQLKISKDGNINQLEVEYRGYKKVYKVLYPYKLNSAGYSTFAFNTAMFTIPFTCLGFVFFEISPFIPIGAFSATSLIGFTSGYLRVQSKPWYWDYNSQINLQSNILKIPIRDSLEKEIKLNKVAVDIKPEKYDQLHITYKEFLADNLPSVSFGLGLRGIKVEQTQLLNELNEIMKKNGYIDTSGYVLKSGFKQNSYLNATVMGIRDVIVPNKISPTDSRITGFIQVRLEIKWELLDYYRNILLTDTIVSKSGEFVRYIDAANSDYYKDALRDAMETGLYTFMQKDKFKTLSMMEKTTREIITDSIIIQAPSQFVRSIEQAAQASVTIKTGKGHGSGFIISEDGYIITNYHVIADTTKLEAILSDGGKCPVQVIRYSKENDLALLKIKKTGLLPFSLKELPAYGMGKEIYIIGTPSAEDLSQTLTRGIISSVRKSANGSQLIQTDASISGGNSGGPMFNKDGQLIGVANAKLVGQGIEGIAFAIPAKDIVKSLVLVLK